MTTTASNPHKERAICLLTNEAGWTNPGFNLVIARAGKGYQGPNEALKPIELQAHAMGAAFGILYEFDVSYYTSMQYPMKEEAWPPYAQDYPMQVFRESVGPRSVDIVFVSILEPNDHRGIPSDPDWIDHGSHVFIKKAFEWMKEKKSGVPLVVLSSNEWIKRYAPKILNWIDDYATAVHQQAKTPLDSSYPQAADKPWWVCNQEWSFWWYSISKPEKPVTDLWLYNGRPAALAAWLDAGSGTPPVDTTPPSAPDGLLAEVAPGEVVLRWNPSTDNIRVTGYRVYADGELLGPASVTWVAIKTSPGMHTFQVEAVDDSGNVSARSAALAVTVPGSAPSGDLAAVMQLLEAIRQGQAEQGAVLAEIRRDQVDQGKTLAEIRGVYR